MQRERGSRGVWCLPARPEAGAFFYKIFYAVRHEKTRNTKEAPRAQKRHQEPTPLRVARGDCVQLITTSEGGN